MAKTTTGATPGPLPSPVTFEGGMVRLHHDAARGCSYGGREYPGDENGDVLVPAEAVSDLLAHGFVPTLQVAAPAPKSSKRLPKE